jgi:transcription antitermination protein NusB
VTLPDDPALDDPALDDPELDDGELVEVELDDEAYEAALRAPIAQPGDELRDDRRSGARERAMGLLYEAEIKGLSPTDVLAALPIDPDPLAVSLVEGVATHRHELDAIVARHLKRGWSLDRLAMLDRVVLVLGTEELVHRPDVPTAVILSEFVILAKAFGRDDDAGRFVNGVLAAVAVSVRGT